MKKILLPLMALMLTMVACQKENDGVFTLSVEEYNTDAKLHLDDAHYAAWDNGDKIWINSAEATVTVSDENSTATISGVASASTYTAIYPARWANTTGTAITYPTSQTYRESNGKQIINAPMAAYIEDDNDNLTFRNLGSLLAVEVSGVTKVQKIEVIAANDVAINGTATISFSGERPALGTLSNGTSTTTLNCNGTTIAEGSSETFYIALPPVTANLTIKVYDDSYCYTRSQTHATAPSYAANHGYNVPFSTTGLTPIQYAPLTTEIWYTATELVSISPTVLNYNDRFYDGNTGKGVFYFAGAVTSIPDNSFKSKTMITSITLPSTVTSIGNSAFANDDGLTSINIPSGVTTIGEKAFQRCYVLDSINLPASLTTIGNYGFDNCRDLTTLVLPSNLTSLGSYAFRNCNLTTLYCYRTTPYTNFTPSDFGITSTTGKTLHVPAGTTSAWSTWFSGGTIVGDL